MAPLPAPALLDGGMCVNEVACCALLFSSHRPPLPPLALSFPPARRRFAIACLVYRLPGSWAPRAGQGCARCGQLAQAAAHTRSRVCAINTHKQPTRTQLPSPKTQTHTHTHLPTPKHPQTRSPDSGNAKSGCSQASLRLSISFGALLVTEFTPLSPFFAEAVRISGWHLFLRRARLSRCHRNGLHPCSLPPAGGLNSVRVAELQCHEIIDVDHVHLPARTINGPLLRIRRRKACIRLHICSMAHNTGVGNGATVHIVIEPENTRGSRSASSAAALAAHHPLSHPLSRAAGSSPPRLRSSQRPPAHPTAKEGSAFRDKRKALFSVQGSLPFFAVPL